MERPTDRLSASQLAEIFGVTARTISNMAASGQIESVIINGRGDRRFSVSGLLTSNTMPEKYKGTLLLWHQQQLQGELSPSANQITENPDNLPIPSNGNQLTRIEDFLKPPECGEEKDPWLNLPESCRDEGCHNYKIVEGARKIKASVKKGQGRTKALALYAEEEGVKPKTLYRWIKKANRALETAKKAGESDLVSPQVKRLSPNFGKNRNRFRSWSIEALAFACSIYLQQGCPNITDVFKDVSETAASNNWKIGTYESLVSVIDRIDKSTVSLARLGKKKFEASRITKILRNYEEIPPNFMWCGDHHIFDVFVKVPDSKGRWKFQRPWVTAWMDMRSRSFVGWVISFKPNSQTIAMALAHGISKKNDPNFLQHGLPDSVYIDNGKDYRAKMLNGEIIEIGNAGKIDYPEIMDKYAALGIDPFYIDLEFDPKDRIWKKKRGKKEIVVKGVRVGGVYNALGIGRHYAIAYHPWAKPIERAFRNVVQSCSRRLPGWCGSTPDQRPEKLADELKSGNILTFEEFTAEFYNYITGVYHKSPHRGHGMNNRTPDEVFQSLLPKPVEVSSDLLDFALAKKERVKIHNWGFVLHGKEFQLDIPSNLYGGHLANNLIGDWARICYDYDFKTVRVFSNGKFVCNGKPMRRASFFDPDCPVMLEKLKLQANQKKATNAVLKAIHGKAKADAPVSDSQALLELTTGHCHPTFEQTAGTDSTPNGIQDDYIPIDPAERYQMILDKMKEGQDLSESDQAFKNDYEKSEEFQSYKHLFTGTMG